MEYADFCSALEAYPKPLAFVDLDALDENIQLVKERVKYKIPIRIATKSIRCVWILNYIREQLGELYAGLMAFSPEEAVWLCQKGFENIVIGYPYVHSQSLKNILAQNSAQKKIVVMVDLIEHLDRLQHIGWSEGKQFLVCVDLDMSTRFPFLYFGVYRSSIRTEKKLKEFLAYIRKCSHLRLVGAMGYEAQISGVQDIPLGKPFWAPIIRILKKNSIHSLTARRQKMIQIIKQTGFSLEFVNGGGTGSLESSLQDATLTEVTVGSAFFAPALFEGYSNFRHRPAAGFALEVTRNPEKGVYTCAGGGYVASGAAGMDKLPQPWLPQGASLIRNEGAGEVQTPIVTKELLRLGMPVIFRHAKAGELCERFNSLLLFRKGKVVQEVLTYRGEGKCFL
ncbi:MAG: alanine racemase [Bacteroidia bacterium]|nr:alanine racemase [Bacteroidia bacterium]MDW8157880.1 alanine racemase [Bacteroidia bacterium]